MKKGTDKSFQGGVAALQEGAEEIVIGHADGDRS